MTEQETPQEAQPIKFRLVIPVFKHQKDDPSKFEVRQRIYEMNQEQGEALNGFIANLASSFGLDAAEAVSLGTRTVLQLIRGKKVNTTQPSAIAWMSRFFPPLTSAQLEALPLVTYPERPEYILLKIGNAETKEVKYKMYRFDADQAQVFSDALEKVNVTSLSGIAAWTAVVGVAGGMLDGASVEDALDPNDDGDMMLMRMAGVFQALSDEEKLALPDATKEQIEEFHSYFCGGQAKAAT